MPVDRRRRGGLASTTRRGRIIAVLLAAVWLVFLAALGAHSVSAMPLQPATPADTTTTASPSGTSSASPPTDTPTVHKGPPTATPTGGLGTATASVTTTVAPTATTSSGGGGGGGNGNPNDPGSGSSDATKVVLAQPTYGAGAGGMQQGITVGSFTSNGLLFASLMSCIVGILGIIVAVIAVQILRRDGYGPFLRALLLGKRASRQPGAKGAVAASAAGGIRRAAWSSDERGEYSAEGERFGGPGSSGFGTRGSPSGPGRRSPGASSPRGRASRPDW